MKILIKLIFTATCLFLPVRTKYHPQNPISNTFKLCSSVNIQGQVPHPYATLVVIILLSSKCHPIITYKIAICWQKTKSDVQKSNSSNCNSIFSVFPAFHTQTVEHVLTTHAIFFIHLREKHYFFKKASQVPTYTNLHKSPANTLQLLLSIHIPQI